MKNVISSRSEGVVGTTLSSTAIHNVHHFDSDSRGLISEYIIFLWQRRVTVLLFSIVGLIISITFALYREPLYQAHAVVEIENVNDNFLNLRSINPTASDASQTALETDLETEVEIIRSDSVLREVLRKVGFPGRIRHPQKEDGPLRRKQFLDATFDNPSEKSDDTLRTLASNLVVRTRPNTRLVDVFYTCPDPGRAAEIANSLIAEFIRQTIQVQRQMSHDTGESLSREVEQVRNRLEQSENRLQDYASSSGLLFTAEKDNLAEDKLKHLQEALSAAQSDRVIWQARYELAVSSQPESLPEVLDNPILKDYQVKLTDLRRQVAEASSTLTAAHPIVKRTEAQVTILETALATERANVIQRIQDEFQSAKRREQLLANGYNAQTRLVAEQAAKATRYNILKREVDNTRQIYDQMLRQVNDAGIASALRASNVRVIDRAIVPQTPFQPQVGLSAALGLCIGTFAGMIWTVGKAKMDRSIRHPGEISAHLQIRELGAIPVCTPQHKTFRFLPLRRTNRSEDHSACELGANAAELATWRKGQSRFADCFRSLLTSILYTTPRCISPQVIVVTSANADEGKTTIASNLALAAAELGRRVLIIDGDLRKPRLDKIFQLMNVPGLSALADETSSDGHLQTCVVRLGYAHLYGMPAGQQPISISRLLHSTRLAEFVTRMRQDFDSIIIDSPPVAQVPDARSLGKLADGVIIVGSAGRITMDDVASVHRRFTEDGTRVIGAVLNRWDPRHAIRPVSGFGYVSHEPESAVEKLRGDQVFVSETIA